MHLASQLSSRQRRAAATAGLAFALLSQGCGDSEDRWHLGPIDAGEPTIDSGGVDTGPSPTPSELGTLACDTAVVPGMDIGMTVRHVATLEGRALVTTPQAVLAHQLNPDGCPGDVIDTFGTGGRLSIEALAAAPLPAGRALVATESGTSLLDANGAVTATCSLDGAELRTRVLHALPTGTAIAAFARSPLTRLSTDLADPTVCQSLPVNLDPSPFAIAAVALTADGFLTVEQASPSSPLTIARYVANGQRVAVSQGSSDASDPAHLCSATGLVETRAGVLVADGACQRVVLFESAQLAVIAEAKVSGSPRGLALVNDGQRALVPVARPIVDGALATYVLVEIATDG